MEKYVQIIAEVKTKSPFGWQSDKDWNELFALADEIADIISIHTDARWGGSFELISKARELTDKPILAKGIHAADSEIAEAIKRGADYVLVVGRVPQIHFQQCLIEPLTLDELKKLPKSTRAVWNSRDLSTGETKTETFNQARNIFKGWLCQASNIKTKADIHSGADAVLVGSHLQSFAESLRENKSEP